VFELLQSEQDVHAACKLFCESAAIVPHSTLFVIRDTLSNVQPLPYGFLSMPNIAVVTSTSRRYGRSEDDMQCVLPIDGHS